MNAARRKWIVRWSVRGVVLLMMGALVSVGVAWGCALGSRTQYIALRPMPQSAAVVVWTPAGWGWFEEQGFGLRRQSAHFVVRLNKGDAHPTHEEVARVGAPWWAVLPAGRAPLRYDPESYFAHCESSTWPWKDSEPVLAEYVFYDAMAAGWPAPCLGAMAGGVTGSELYGGFRYPWSSPTSAIGRTIPMRPVWIGLITNSAIYGAALGVLGLCPRVVRTQARARCGLCVRCGYDVRGGGSGTCPECGRGLGDAE